MLVNSRPKSLDFPKSMINKLVQYSLVSRDKDCIYIHELLSEIVIEYVSPDPNIRFVSNFTFEQAAIIYRDHGDKAMFNEYKKMAIEEYEELARKFNSDKSEFYYINQNIYDNQAHEDKIAYYHILYLITCKYILRWKKST